MVNTDSFIKRLEIILDYYSLNASSFADKISVQRSSLSHLLSGRNKPSLDFILKIIEVFPEVDLYWILNGKGNFPKSDLEKETQIQTLTLTTSNQIVENKIDNQADLFSSDSKKEVEENLKKMFLDKQKFETTKNISEIDRIVVFYKNRTFKTYSPE